MISTLFELDAPPPIVTETFDGLLVALAAAGVSLSVRGIKLIAAPADALNAELLNAMRARKHELVEHARLFGPCEQCGQNAYRDVPVHNGRSVRRDCCCGRTLGFPVWNPSPFA